MRAGTRDRRAVPGLQRPDPFATAYPWYDSAFVTPDFTNMIVYQFHIGTYAPATPGAAGSFLDIISKISYLVALGANLLQPLPTLEVETDPSLGYDGLDYFSPDSTAGRPRSIDLLLGPRHQPREQQRQPLFHQPDRSTGGFSFALWKNDVRQFLINNVLYYISEFRADGFRYDESAT